MFNIEVVKDNVVGVVAVVDSVFGFSLNGFDDFDHDECHIDISFFVVSMLDLHELSQGHLAFIQRSFFFFMAVARWRATHLLDFLLTHYALRADVTFLFGWSVVSSSGASGSWSWAFDIFWFTHSWFISWFEGGRPHLVGGFQFFPGNLQLNFQILDFISKSSNFIDGGLIFVSVFIQISFHILDFLLKFNFDVDEFGLFGQIQKSFFLFSGPLPLLSRQPLDFWFQFMSLSFVGCVIVDSSFL